MDQRPGPGAIRRGGFFSALFFGSGTVQRPYRILYRRQHRRAVVEIPEGMGLKDNLLHPGNLFAGRPEGSLYSI